MRSLDYNGNDDDDNDDDDNNKTLKVEDVLKSIPIGHPDSMMSKESVRRAIEEFSVNSQDIIVATFPKTGTTVITWICHLLRTIPTLLLEQKKQDGKNNGDYINDEEIKLKVMNSFDTMYEVCPWPTLSWDIGYDPNVQGLQPKYLFNSSTDDNDTKQPIIRVFKSHLRMASIYKGCKYIVTVRDPAKTALSFYNFFISKKVPFILKMDISAFLINTPFVKGINTKDEPNKRGSIWDYYSEYHELLNCDDVLILIYEDLLSNMSKVIKLVGQFMGIITNDNNPNNNDNNTTKHILTMIASMTTKEYMSKYMSKFDEPYERAMKLNRAADISQLAPGDKIATKQHEQIFNEEAKQFLSMKWNESMNDTFGYIDYNDFCNTIRKRNAKLFGC